MPPAELVIKFRDAFGHGNDRVNFRHSYPLNVARMDRLHPPDNVRPVRDRHGDGEQPGAEYTAT
ncbi:hypothetical protein SXIM_15930 [Streptomyces xiamenensis]|uniref:Uncharacterized protein n=1 Tax=Streptomyces xiamenensis TaxID=408015 RepID=A0A0F7FRT7_9ACTN|nr:hypothetical protein SXIM_15930 [Streptomyces xiamenensis]